MLRQCLTVLFVCLSLSCLCGSPLQAQENATTAEASSVQPDAGANALDVEFDLGNMEEEFESGNVDELTPEQEQRVKVWRFTLRTILVLICVAVVVIVIRFAKRRKQT